jgi:leader peptidase (prepilin peptidase)/N-methyltransferase
MVEMTALPLIILSLILGASFGSFLNVVIYRLPRRQSIAFPASHCPVCNTKIKPYDNIPVLSYILLGGKCRNCKAHISLQYPLVELLTACSFVALIILNDYLLDLTLLKNLIFFCGSIAIIFIDFKHFIIPDVISLSLIIVGVIFAFFIPEPSWQSSIIGAAVGFTSFYLIAWAFFKIKGQVGLGGGDIKYVTAIGAFIGIIGLGFVVFFSSVIALIYQILRNIKTKEQTPKIIPYGPFLAIAALIYILIGDHIVDWYLNIFYLP